MQVLPCGFHPCSCNFENVSQKESQTRIYGTGNNSVHKYIDLRSGIQQNRNVPSPVSPARGIKAFQLILQPCHACHPAHLLWKLLVQSFWPRWLDAWPYTCCIMSFPGKTNALGQWPDHRDWGLPYHKQGRSIALPYITFHPDLAFGNTRTFYSVTVEPH